jgi:hypothetical protein
MHRFGEGERNFDRVRRARVEQLPQPLDRLRALTKSMLKNAFEEIQVRVGWRDAQPAIGRVGRPREPTRRKERACHRAIARGQLRKARDEPIANLDGLGEALLSEQSINFGDLRWFVGARWLHG